MPVLDTRAVRHSPSWYAASSTVSISSTLRAARSVSSAKEIFSSALSRLTPSRTARRFPDSHPAVPEAPRTRQSLQLPRWQRRIQQPSLILLGSNQLCTHCLLYTSDAADDLLCVDLGGRRIIKKKINK